MYISYRASLHLHQNLPLHIHNVGRSYLETPSHWKMLVLDLWHVSNEEKVLNSKVFYY